jgi:hypothetical protein
VVRSTPEEAQLETPHARIASSATSSSALRRRHSPNGTSATAQASGSTGHAKGRRKRADELDCPVAIVTVSSMDAVEEAVGLEGLKVQEE